MRGANDFAPAQLAAAQLPAVASSAATAVASGQPQAATRLWSAYMGGRPVLLVRSVDSARRLLLRALVTAAQDTVLLPANVTPALLATIKRSGASICFGDLDYALNLCSEGPVRIAWAEPLLGLPTGVAAPAKVTVIDHGDSLPHGGARPPLQLGDADVILYGLQLAAEDNQAGAVLVFHDPMLAARVAALAGEDEQPDSELALARLAQLRQWAPRQLAALATIRTGLQAAAGLPLLPTQFTGALARGVAVRIPAECSAATFVAYLRGEQTPFAWLAEARPLHYAAAQRQATAVHLERWLLAPVHAGAEEGAQRQTVLGIVKTAEYLGVRWRTDPARAAEYAALLTRMYGPDHDAYRPAFDVGAQSSPAAELAAEDLQAPACRLDKSGLVTHPALPLAATV